MRTIILTLALVCPYLAFAADPPQRSELRHTYSIIAYDPDTGEIGAAVQTHWFNAGVGVLWVEPGVGAVATQSFLEPAYGARGLALMRDGSTATEAMEQLASKDPGKAVRQVAMLDVNGDVASFTGEKAIAEHCRVTGKRYATQANLMWKPGVCRAMAEAFEESGGDLAERMLDALDAAEDAGGDIRGKQSAAILVMAGERDTPSYKARKYDLRVDDSHEPLKEMRRLLTTARAYRHMDIGDSYLAKSDIPRALQFYEAAMAIAPDNHEMVFWTAVTLADTGALEQSQPLFSQAFSAWPRWRELVPRLPDSGLLPDDDALIAQILAIE